MPLFQATNSLSIPLVSLQPFKENQGPLASSLAFVQVDFNTVDFPDSPDTFQNDGVSGRDRKPNQDSYPLTDILIGIPLNDEKKPNGESHPNKNGILSLYPLPKHSFKEVSALEIGMYVLLSTFCFAIVVFVVSCFVYASKHKMINAENKPRPTGQFPILRESRKNREPTTNVHNWVWLGRSTMDHHSSILQDNNENFMNPRGECDAHYFISTSILILLPCLDQIHEYALPEIQYPLITWRLRMQFNKYPPLKILTVLPEMFAMVDRLIGKSIVF